ncbi:type 3 multicopper oxidase [Arthrobacter crystallopoietes BAB-32]|uniref:Copper-containing nitrite reductase n=1 Tax=Arthrobacter crystallopoietes BAB-32 TaxID=1246476 RepID=N1V7R5_9MICC|nr:multicopper oxidase domain-containing protein [Arthrobacter crystallopoietes]EMY34273.1 type 3 multicopper oxidase [Arthrobacter crystallopoietes BAB-32]
MTLPAPTRPAKSARASWHRKASLPVTVWFVLLIVLAFVHPFVPESRWLLVHMFTLGMVTNSILIWSQHFTEALLKNRLPDSARRVQLLRLRIMNAGIVVTIAGILPGIWPLTLAGAVLVGGAVAWHAVHLMLQLRRALPARFSTTVRFYIAAALLLPVGAAFGAVMAYGLDDAAHARFLLAHQATNLLGFVGLTMVGTLITLWPTILRTRMTVGMEVAGWRSLVAMAAGLAVCVLGALAGLAPAAAFGVVLYVLGIGYIGVHFVRCAVASPPTDFPALSVGAGLLWLAGSLIALAAVLLNGPLEPARLEALTVPFAAGFVAQVLLGVMAYLMPTIMGGGPATVKAAGAEMGRAAMLRLAVVNCGLVVCLLPVPGWARVIVSVLILLAFASFLPLMFRSVRISVAGRKAMMANAGKPLPLQTGQAPKPANHLAWGASGLVLVLLGTLSGIALEPGALSGGARQAATVAPTGETTTVRVSAADMRFTPSSVEVPAGNRLVIELTNDDPSTVHDLRLVTGPESGRLHPGESATIDAGIIGADVDGWCTVVGHRSQGMVFDVNVIGGPASGEEAPASGHTGHTANDGGAVPSIDFLAPPGTDYVPRAADLEPAAEGTTHRLTLDVEELAQEVAPDVRQQAWTFNGRVMGPTLRGKVGDRFEITLVNRGSMGHSVDYHAGAVSPDEPMRTIPPGESLVYEFTASRSGIWLYHCGTAPVSAHIAAGLFGAVLIDPPGLPDVDREFLLVQSETYLGEPDAPVNVGKIQAEEPDIVMFNGHATQYRHHPLAAAAGERVRIWVLNAGPSRGTSFHVIGGQFDAVFKEGAWLLEPDNPGQGGAQALDLSAAQGGFAELEFAKPGRYTFLSHALVDAERGALGFIDVE